MGHSCGLFVEILEEASSFWRDDGWLLFVWGVGYIVEHSSTRGMSFSLSSLLSLSSPCSMENSHSLPNDEEMGRVNSTTILFEREGRGNVVHANEMTADSTNLYS